MDRERLRELKDHLDFLDERFSHRLRASSGGSLIRMAPEDLERRQRELSEYLLELRTVLRDLVEALEAPEVLEAPED